MADELAAVSTDLPVKRPREDEEENGVAPAAVPDSISAVIPGWFSEISPMWPGSFLAFSLLCLAAEKVNLDLLSLEKCCSVVPFALRLRINRIFGISFRFLTCLAAEKVKLEF